MTPAEHLADSPLGLAVFDVVSRTLDGFGPFEVRTSASQVAFRRRRGFAVLWLPGRYLRRPDAEVVLSVLLDHADPSPRFKEVVQVTRSAWQHHLELHRVEDVDEQVVGWLRAAYDAAG